jgi:hypothetical protein
MEQQKTSLGRDRDADLVSNLEPATSFESFFGKEYLNVTKQFEAIAPGQFMKKDNMPLNQGQPLLGKRSRSQATSPLLSQPLKDHMKIGRFTTFVLADALRY